VAPSDFHKAEKNQDWLGGECIHMLNHGLSLASHDYQCFLALTPNLLVLFVLVFRACKVSLV
jgi:hypothetical protein